MNRDLQALPTHLVDDAQIRDMAMLGIQAGLKIEHDEFLVLIHLGGFFWLHEALVVFRLFRLAYFAVVETAVVLLRLLPAVLGHNLTTIQAQLTLRADLKYMKGS
jgi:hypothetical protein